MNEGMHCRVFMSPWGSFEIVQFATNKTEEETKKTNATTKSQILMGRSLGWLVLKIRCHCQSIVTG
jgi:hypothetical protein